MNKLSKREKFLIFFKIFLIIVFLVVFPYIVLVARGYRYNPKTKKFQATGLLIVKSTPSTDLRIYIDDKLQKNNRTPLKKNLFEGEHKIKIEKDGYNSWEKLVKIEKEKICWEESVVLIPNELEKILIKENVKEYTFSPNLNFIVSISPESPDKITILNLKSQEKKIFAVGKNLSILDISPNEENILLQDIVGNKKELKVFNYKNEKTYNFENILKASFLDNDKVVAQNNNGQLLLYLISQQTSNVNIIDNNVLNFAIRNKEEIFITKKDSQKIYLVIKNINSSKEKILKEVQKPEIQYIKSEKNNQEALIVNNGELYFFQNNQLNLIDKEVKKAFFNQNGQRLLYNKNYEIWLYFIYKDRIKVDQKQLVLRLSENIDSFIFYPDEMHILFQQKNKIFFVDFDGQNKVEITNQSKNQNKLFYIIDNNEFFYINNEDSLIKIKFPKKETFVETLENLFLIRWSS